MFGLKTMIVAVGMIQTALATVNTSTSGSQGQGSAADCSTKCMTIKLQEAVHWFGQGNLTTYCTHAEFLTAYDTCVSDNCNSAEVDEAKKTGHEACAAAAHGLAPGNGTTPLPNGGSANGHPSPIAGNNSPADLPTQTSNRTIGSGATLNSTLLPGSNTTTASNSRFSNAVNSAASAAANSTASGLTASSILVGLSSVLAIITV